MLRFDPFTDIDAITKSLLATGTGSSRSPRFMPMDLYKIDDHYVPSRPIFPASTQDQWTYR